VRMKTVLTLCAALALMAGVATASSSVTLEGSFFRTFKRPSTDTITCPQNVDGNECGVIQFTGLGPADYDGNGKAWVRFDDGEEATVGGSRVERNG